MDKMICTYLSLQSLFLQQLQDEGEQEHSNQHTETINPTAATTNVKDLAVL